MKLSKTFQYRNIWLGVAMIFIVLFHSGFMIPVPILQFIKEIGYFGVEICLFASGFGCYYSLEKDSHALRFLKRRAKRLCPVYLCFIIPWLLCKLYVGHFPLSAVLGNLLGVQSLISWDYHFNWYIGCLVVFYILAPYFKQITDTCQSSRSELLVLLMLVLCGIPFWCHDHLIVIVARLPIFYLGMIYAKHAVTGSSISQKSWLLHILASLCGIMTLLFVFFRFPNKVWSYGLCWYPFILIVPGLCMALSKFAFFFETHPRMHWLNALLNTIGSFSFEVYLIHVFLYETIMPRISDRLSMIPQNLIWLATVPVIIIGSFLLNWIASFSLSIMSRCNKK